MKSFDELMALVDGCKADVAKVDKGEKAAQTRVRVAMQEIEAQAGAVRNEILAIREAKA
jgi:hypothetical protein